MAIYYLVSSLLIAAAVFKIGHDAGWHWAVALLLALIPIAFAWLVGFIGILVGLALLSAIWRATAV